MPLVTSVGSPKHSQCGLCKERGRAPSKLAVGCSISGMILMPLCAVRPKPDLVHKRAGKPPMVMERREIADRLSAAQVALVRSAQRDALGEYLVVGSPAVDAALRYARRGWRVFPRQWRGARMGLAGGR